MRTASINLDRAYDSIQAAGCTADHTFVADIFRNGCEPALAGAGKLWTWAPQLRYAHQIPLQSGQRLQLELGLWDPPTAGYSTNELFRAPSPSEASKQPGYESRVSYGTLPENILSRLGSADITAVKAIPATRVWTPGQLHGLARSAWRSLRGQRGRISWQGYWRPGGGVYKDVLFGVYTSTGQNA